jgi:aspartyl protease family protein
MANEKRDAKAMRSFLAVAAIALAAAVLVPRYMTQRTTVSAAPPMMAAHIDAPAQTASSDSRSVVVAPDSQGHFRVEARVDNRRMDFLVDTGASVIALTARDAATLGIHPADSEYTMAVRTANGTVHAAPVNRRLSDRAAGRRVERQPARHGVPVAAAPLRIFRRQARSTAVTLSSKVIARPARGVATQPFPPSAV